MKTTVEVIEEQLNQEFSGHPSRDEWHRIKTLEHIVKILASEIDNLRNNIS